MKSFEKIKGVLDRWFLAEIKNQPGSSKNTMVDESPREIKMLFLMNKSKGFVDMARVSEGVSFTACVGRVKVKGKGENIQLVRYQKPFEKGWHEKVNHAHFGDVYCPFRVEKLDDRTKNAWREVVLRRMMSNVVHASAQKALKAWNEGKLNLAQHWSDKGSRSWEEVSYSENEKMSGFSGWVSVPKGVPFFHDVDSKRLDSLEGWSPQEDGTLLNGNVRLSLFLDKGLLPSFEVSRRVGKNNEVCYKSSYMDMAVRVANTTVMLEQTNHQSVSGWWVSLNGLDALKMNASFSNLSEYTVQAVAYIPSPANLYQRMADSCLILEKKTGTLLPESNASNSGLVLAEDYSMTWKPWRMSRSENHEFLLSGEEDGPLKEALKKLQALLDRECTLSFDVNLVARESFLQSVRSSPSENNSSETDDSQLIAEWENHFTQWQKWAEESEDMAVFSQECDRIVQQAIQSMEAARQTSSQARSRLKP